MDNNRESIFYTSLRAFFKTIFVMLGIGIGLMAITVLISTLSTSVGSNVETYYKQKILADASGSRKELAKTSPVILQIDIQGVIGLDGLKVGNIRNLLQESREGDFEGDRVKAVLLNIKTPGGTAIDSDGIYREIKTYKEKYKVPVYAYVDGLCASGGIYIICAADNVYTSESSLIGSVGVILPSALNLSQLMDKIGVFSLTLYAGKGKDELNPLRPWKDDEGKNYKEIIDGYYKQFVGIVTNNRTNVNPEKLVNDYGAQVFLAHQAQEIGYIDKSGISYQQTIAALAEEAGLKQGEYQVIGMECKGWLSSLFETESSLLKGTIKHRFIIGEEFDSALMNQFLYLYTPLGR